MSAPPSEFGVMLQRLKEISQPVDRVSRHLLYLDVHDLWYWAVRHPETVEVFIGSPQMSD